MKVQKMGHNFRIALTVDIGSDASQCIRAIMKRKLMIVFAISCPIICSRLLDVGARLYTRGLIPLMSPNHRRQSTKR